MAANHQFSIAAHLMAGLGFCTQTEKTSADLAKSVNTSPSFIRRTLSKLAKAGLVETTKGKNGCCRLARPAAEITLLEIYRAVDAPRAFSIHQYAELPPCAVSCHIKQALEKVLDHAQAGLEHNLAGMTLADLIADIQRN